MAITEMQDDDLDYDISPSDLELETEMDDEVKTEEELDTSSEEAEVDKEEKEEKEETKEEYSRRVQKRIDTLTYRAKTAEEETMAEREERLRLQKELDELKSRESETSLKHLESRHEAAKEKYRQAYENGDGEEVAKAQAELSEISAELVLAKRTPVQKEEAPKSVEAKTDPNEPHPAAKAWLRENKDWFNDPKNQRYRAAAIVIERELRDEGYEMGEELYEELDKRLEEEMPKVRNLRGLDVGDDVEEKGQQEEKLSTRGKQQIAGQGRGGEGTPRPKQGSKRLTQDDLKSMMKYGFDPNSPEDRKAWLNRDKI